MICGRIKPTTSPYGYSSFRKEENWEFRVPTFLLDYLTTHYLTTFKFLSISFLMASTDEVVVRPSLGVFRQ